MNVTELARQLKIHNKDRLFSIIQELGFDIGKRAIKIDDRVAHKIIQLYKEKVRSENKQADAIKIRETAEAHAKANQDIEIPEKISVKEFSEIVALPVTEIIKTLMQNGIMASMNENIDAETAVIIAEDLGYNATIIKNDKKELRRDESNIEKVKNILDNQKETTGRPPVVVVMGHVDHGKTKLLDAIRNTHVVDEEAGGITQHIGAYQVKEKDQLITFIDTPGHEAFTAMRSRGANVADIAILVVAADDGIKPQTMEAIEIMGKAELPFIVAINKIDKPGADIDNVKKQLSELNLIPEDWGGKTICVEISAKEMKNIDKLLEMILLVADMENEKIQADSNAPVLGTIIEAKVDKGEGPVATVVIQNGTLRVGDLVMVGGVPGKIKSLKDWKQKTVKTASPSTPVRILGLKSAPTVGDILEQVKDKKLIRKANKRVKTQTSNISQDEPDTSMEMNEVSDMQKILPIVLKTDALGSLEAIIASLEKINNQDILVKIVHKGLGNISEKDITQGEASQAVVFGFNVKLGPNVLELSRKAGVTVEMYSIIYELLDRVKEEAEKMLEPEVTYRKIGELKVLAIFKDSPSNKIIGGKIEKGKIINPAVVKIISNGQEIDTGKVTELQCEKQKVSSVNKGVECGLKIETTSPILENDTLEIYETVLEKKSL